MSKNKVLAPMSRGTSLSTDWMTAVSPAGCSRYTSDENRLRTPDMSVYARPVTMTTTIWPVVEALAICMAPNDVVRKKIS